MRILHPGYYQPGGLWVICPVATMPSSACREEETILFENRTDAGIQLAQALSQYEREDVVILAINQGGVVVGDEVSRRLGKPLDMLLVNKLGAPGQKELGIGAVGPNGAVVLNQSLVASMGITEDYLQEEIRRESAKLTRCLMHYRDNRPFPLLTGKVVILISDGLATSARARAAIAEVRAMRAVQVVLSVPVGANATINELRHEVDDLICLRIPEGFESVRHYFQDFPEISDIEVIEQLEKAWGNDLGDMTVQARSIGPP
jgi:putative phosphoribosyl transferase